MTFVPKLLTVVLASLLLLCAVGGRGVAAPDPAETAAGVIRDLDLQTRLPIAPELETPPSKVHLHIPEGLAEIVLYGALVVGVVFAGLALRDSLPRRSRATTREGDATVTSPMAPAAVARMSETAVEADDLARRGLFAEAMHALLLRSLAELRAGLDIALAASLTSRELLPRLPLPEAGRAALADLIRFVEYAYFGGYAADARDYQACRRSYEVLTGAMLARSGP